MKKLLLILTALSIPLSAYSANVPKTYAKVLVGLDITAELFDNAEIIGKFLAVLPFNPKLL